MLAHRLLLFGLLYSSLSAGCHQNARPSAESPTGRSATSRSAPSAVDRANLLQTHRPTDVLGQRVTLLPENAKGLLLIFSRQDCPIAIAYAPRIEQLYKVYEPQGVHCILVQTDKFASLEVLQAHVHDYQWTLPVVHDKDHQLVDWFEARVTPQAALVNRAGEMVYLGRIDDQYVDLGKKRPEPTRHDLQEALDAFLANAPIPQARTVAVGCVIER